MSRVNTYLNFPGTTEEAFDFYKSVFATEYASPIFRFRDLPGDPTMAALSESDQGKVMHVELPILNGHLIMGTDMLESMGQHPRIGNNTTISLEFDSRDDADRAFGALSDGGSDTVAMQDMPWGAYWGVCLDRFGIRWMFSYTEPAP
ncbi:MAG: VOC family protein [Acidimicrobiales bacterium]|jgi:PhnB protein